MYTILKFFKTLSRKRALPQDYFHDYDGIGKDSYTSIHTKLTILEDDPCWHNEFPNPRCSIWKLKCNMLQYKNIKIPYSTLSNQKSLTLAGKQKNVYNTTKTKLTNHSYMILTSSFAYPSCTMKTSNPQNSDAVSNLLAHWLPGVPSNLLAHSYCAYH